MGSQNLPPSDVELAMEMGLQRITHADIMADMEHDGYAIEQRTRQVIIENSQRSPAVRDLVNC